MKEKSQNYHDTEKYGKKMALNILFYKNHLINVLPEHHRNGKWHILV